jgi:hypothetical protein
VTKLNYGIKTTVVCTPVQKIDVCIASDVQKRKAQGIEHRRCEVCKTLLSSPSNQISHARGGQLCVKWRAQVRDPDYDYEAPSNGAYFVLIVRDTDRISFTDGYVDCFQYYGIQI